MTMMFTDIMDWREGRVHVHELEVQRREKTPCRQSGLRKMYKSYRQILEDGSQASYDIKQDVVLELKMLQFSVGVIKINRARNQYSRERQGEQDALERK